MVKITTNDSKVIQIPNDIGSKCGLIKNMIEDIQEEDLVIPINNVSYEVLKKVFDFCSQEVNTTEYMKMEQEFLFEVTIAANYLQHETLLDECCKEIAHRLENKSVEEIREILQIPEDYSNSVECK